MPSRKSQSLLTSAATIVESCLHAVKRLPSEGRGKAALIVPIRFVFRNKLTQDDRSLAFDALVVSELHVYSSCDFVRTWIPSIFLMQKT